MACRIWCVKWYIQCSQWQKKLGWFFCAGQRECADLRKHVSWQCAPVEPGMVWPGNGIERLATRRFCTAACLAMMELGKIASRISLSPVKEVKFAQRPARLSPVWSVPRPAPRRFWHSGLPDVNGAAAKSQAGSPSNSIVKSTNHHLFCRIDLGLFLIFWMIWLRSTSKNVLWSTLRWNVLEIMTFARRGSLLLEVQEKWLYLFVVLNK